MAALGTFKYVRKAITKTGRTRYIYAGTANTYPGVSRGGTIGSVRHQRTLFAYPNRSIGRPVLNRARTENVTRGLSIYSVRGGPFGRTRRYTPTASSLRRYQRLVQGVRSGGVKS